MNFLRHPGMILVLVLIVILLFGSKRLPDVAKSVGQSMKIFKKEVHELRDEDSASTTDAPGTSTTASATGTGVSAGSDDAAPKV